MNANANRIIEAADNDYEYESVADYVEEFNWIDDAADDDDDADIAMLLEAEA